MLDGRPFSKGAAAVAGQMQIVDENGQTMSKLKVQRNLKSQNQAKSIKPLYERYTHLKSEIS